MQRVTRIALKRSFNKQKHHAIKSLEGYAAPDIKRRWGDLSNLSVSEKHEITSGSWRNAQTVKLVTDDADRDKGGFVDPVEFASDEAAQLFIAEEDRDDQEERQIPTLQLAQQFFTDLAETADEEVDVQSSGASPMSDDARRLEEVDVNRQFFADYYIEQGAIPESMRYPFINSMLQSSVSLFHVNEDRPLARLVLRDQLEHHVHANRGSVLLPTPDPLTYKVEMMPSQYYGEPTQEIYNEHTSPIAQRESLALQESTDSALPDDAADNLSMMLCDDEFIGMDSLSAADPPRGDVSVAIIDDANTESLPAQPPALGHMHWLQRQVAADALGVTDLLSPIITTLCTYVPTSNHGAEARIILDLFGARNTQYYYYRDVSLKLQAMQRNHIMIVSLPPNKMASTDDEVVHDAPISEHTLGTVFIQPQGTKEAKRLCAPLCGACDVVLCSPSCSDDGLRPNCTLSDNSNSQDDRESAAVADRFIDVCSGVNDHFTRLSKQLLNALSYAKRDGRGWVVYATRSMNPVENEAVVSSVLTYIRQKYEAGKEQFVVECVPIVSSAIANCLPGDEQESLEVWLRYGGPGLSTWKSLEGCPPEQAVEQCDPDIVQSVASASWRSDPQRSGFDGCFLALLRVVTDSSRQLQASDVVPDKESNYDAIHICPLVLSEVNRKQLLLRYSSVEVLSENFNQSREWSIIKSGIPVGAVAPNGALQLTSSISGRESVLGLMTIPNVESCSCQLAISISMLCELLRLRKLSSRFLERRMQRRRLHRGVETADTYEDTEIKSFTASVRSMISRIEHGGKYLSRYPVFLTPAPLLAEHDGVPMQMHEGVSTELSQVMVIASLSTTSDDHFTLELSVPSDMQDYTLHHEAVSESTVSLRDSLLYILRRAHVTEILNFANRASDGNDTMQDEQGDVLRHPNSAEEVIQLQEEEFEISSTPSELVEEMLSVGERRKHEQRLRSMKRTLHQHGVPADDGPVKNDWVRDLSYGSQRRNKNRGAHRR